MRIIFPISLTLIGMLFASSAFANREILKQEIQELSKITKIESKLSQASESSLRLAKQKLLEVNQLLSGKSGNNTGPGSETAIKCFDFAFKKYYVEYTSSVATDKAVAGCKGVADVAIMQYLWEKFYKDLTSSAAMDKSIALSGTDTAGKLPLIQFLFEKYYKDYTTTHAILSAVEKATLVDNEKIDCIRTFWERYYKDFSNIDSINKALAACR